jgi:DNA-binding SARP family transcriptional activator
MTAVRFTILGPVRARRGDTDLDLGGRQQRLVLALLLARAGTLVGLSELVDAVWEDDPPASAVNVVHRYIGTLRRLIEPGLPVRATGEHLIRLAAGYQLTVGEDELDLHRFRRLVARARSEPDPAVAVRSYLDALSLWQGPCAAGLEPIVRTHPTFVAIDAERSQALRDAADTALIAGHVRTLLPVLRQAAGWSPLDEPLQARLITALAADGRQAEAVETYQEVRRRLAGELGIAPGPELTETYDRLLHQRPAGPGPAGGPDPLPSSLPLPPPLSSPLPPPPAASPLPAGGTGPPTPAQLPPDHPFFSGRAELVTRLHALADDGRRRGRAAVTLAIDGMPGVGKTTLAVHLGHRLAADYPDGQLYADLRGFTAQGSVMSPAEALRGFLSSLGVPQDTLPAELHALAGLYRSLLAGRRVLIVLDNARDFEQVRHLLPGTPGSLAVVTSRVRITALITTGGAHPVPLDVPSAREARDALAERLGAGRVAAEPAAVDEILARCGRLPLAMAVVIARAMSLPDTPLAEMAAELAAAGAPLDGFGDGGLGDGLETDLAAVFSWSYRALSPAAARLFRLLPLHPGPDLGAPVAACLAGVDARTGRALLGELAGQLLIQVRSRRYQVHDLLRAYAAGLSAEQDGDRERHDARQRMFEHYRAGAYRAHLLLEPNLPAPAPPEPGPGVIVPEPRTADEAMAWFDAERRVLTSVVEQADPPTGWLVALTMQNFLHFTGRTREWETVSRGGLAAATADGDPAAQAQLSRSLAGALFMLHDFDRAAEHLDRAGSLLDRLGDRRGLAVVELNWAYLRAEQDRHADSVRHAERALALFRDAGDEQDQARALRTIAGGNAALGRGEEALRLLRETLTLSAASDDHTGAGHSWDLLGRTYRLMGRTREAIAHWERAAGAYRLAGTPAALADVLLTLGDAHQEAGDHVAAREHWREALDALADPAGPLARDLNDRLAPT